MIVYTPFWETLKKRGMTSYSLMKNYKISSSIVDKLRNDIPMSTYTLDNFCRILNCTLDEIAKYVPDEEYEDYKKEFGYKSKSKIK